MSVRVKGQIHNISILVSGEIKHIRVQLMPDSLYPFLELGHEVKTLGQQHSGIHLVTGQVYESYLGIGLIA